jgi:hypothetical protein
MRLKTFYVYIELLFLYCNRKTFHCEHCLCYKMVRLLQKRYLLFNSIIISIWQTLTKILFWIIYGRIPRVDKPNSTRKTFFKDEVLLGIWNSVLIYFYNFTVYFAYSPSILFNWRSRVVRVYLMTIGDESKNILFYPTEWKKEWILLKTVTV